MTPLGPDRPERAGRDEASVPVGRAALGGGAERRRRRAPDALQVPPLANQGARGGRHAAPYRTGTVRRAGHAAQRIHVCYNIKHNLKRAPPPPTHTPTH